MLFVGFLLLHGFIFFLIYLFLIGGQLLYNIVLVSAIHQCESSHRHTYVPYLSLTPTRHPILLF